MAGQIAEAYVQIIPTTDGIAGGIAKALGGEGEKSGKSFGQSFFRTTSKVLSAIGVAKIFKSAIDAGAALEQNIGGTEAVFGGFAETVQEKAAAAYKKMGLSASDYMATANKMGSLFQGSGLDQQKSLMLTTSAMQRAADIASVMGIDASTAMESIAGAAKGNFTMMDNLGVAMNATTLAAYALEKGVNFDWNTASNAEKAELAMQMFMERTAQYAGNYASEAVGTFSGSMEAMKAAATNLLADMATGRDVTASMQGLSTSLTNFINNAAPMITSFAAQAPGVLVNLIKAIAPVLWDAGKAMISSFISIIGEAMAPLAVAAKNLWTRIVTAFNETKGNIISSVKSAISNAVNAVKSFAGQMLAAGKALISNVATGIANGVSNAVSKARELGQRILSTITGFVGQMVSAGYNLLMGVAAGIGNAVGGAVAKAKEAASQIVNSVKSFLGIASPSKLMRDEVGKYVMLGFAEGIAENTAPVANAIDEVGAMAATGFENTLGVNAALGVSADAEATTDLATLIRIVNGLSTKIENLKIYLDGERLVGGIAPGMDSVLGGRSLMAERGLA